ncbi:hypothetical protein [Brevibacillus agri]|uniref:hypothetical protein n=1 Tax=Brevibacillus agri TaxID=51101 RepID=UPI003D7243E9
MSAFSLISLHKHFPVSVWLANVSRKWHANSIFSTSSGQSNDRCSGCSIFFSRLYSVWMGMCSQFQR